MLQALHPSLFHAHNVEATPRDVDQHNLEHGLDTGHHSTGFTLVFLQASLCPQRRSLDKVVDRELDRVHPTSRAGVLTNHQTDVDQCPSSSTILTILVHFVVPAGAVDKPASKPGWSVLDRGEPSFLHI